MSPPRTWLLLEVLVGSRAHHLASSDSDYDYRGVFVVPTVDLLGLGPAAKHTQWIEGQTDNTSWEVGHFLFLATKCNPNILDVFRAGVTRLAPPEIARKQSLLLWPHLLKAAGKQLLLLWPHLVSRRQARDAFLGYARNQFKKMMDQEAVDTPRVWKFGTTYLRVLQQGIDLQETGTYSLAITDPAWRAQLMAVREGRCTRGQIIDNALRLQERLFRAETQSVLPEAPNLDAVNQFLLQVRRDFWAWDEETNP